MELLDEGEREAKPLKFGAVSNTWSRAGAAVKEYTLMIDFRTTTMRSRLQHSIISGFIFEHLVLVTPHILLQ